MNKSGFATPQVLIFVLALAAVAGGYLTFKPETKNEVDTLESAINSTIEEVEGSDWQTYRNEEYGFEFKYPSQFAVAGPQSKRFSTGLVFLKYLGKEGTNGNALVYVSVETDSTKTSSCLVHEGGGKSAGPVILTQSTSTPSGIWYLDQSLDYGMSQKYDIKNFITVRNGKCLEFSLLVHTANLGVYDPGTVAEFDATEVNSLFSKIFSTFRFIPLDTKEKSQMYIISPSGGEVWHILEVREIKWIGGTPNDTVWIFQTLPTGLISTIAPAGTPNTGSFKWTIPGNYPTTESVMNPYNLVIRLSSGEEVASKTFQILPKFTTN